MLERVENKTTLSMQIRPSRPRTGPGFWQGPAVVFNLLGDNQNHGPDPDPAAVPEPPVVPARVERLNRTCNNNSLPSCSSNICCASGRLERSVQALAASPRASNRLAALKMISGAVNRYGGGRRCQEEA